MERWFAYESGMPWCESAYKYQTLPMIAEFTNTVTNLPIIVLPLVNAFMLRDYIRRVNGYVFLPHMFLAINGIASTFYHATLTLFGQLVDELSLLWLIMVCIVAFLPIMQSCPQSVRRRITSARLAIVGVTALISALCFIKPSLNAFALMIISVPTAALIYHEGASVNMPNAELIMWRVFKLWALAMAFWFSDRMFCDFWLYLGTPYFHAVFHILSSYAAYNLFITLSMLDVKRRAKEHNLRVELRYFPSTSVESPSRFSFPYVSMVEEDASVVKNALS